MEPEMAAMFPKGIRALMVDDDNRFVRSSTNLLSVLNFEVVSCSTVAHALKSLSTLKLNGIDVVLVHAAKAAACGFNFRAIIEADLGIPVIYFLPLDHRATGDEAAELLRTLEEGTYIMTKPLDIDEVRSRLWRVIAWRKCDLQRRPAGGGDGFLEGEDDEGRVHYKVVRRGRRGQKRKGGGNNATGCAGAGGRQHPEPAGKGKEKVNEGDYYQQQPAQQIKKRRGRKPKKITTGEAFTPFQFQHPSKAVVRQPPRPSLFVNFFSDGAGPRNISTAAAAAAPPPPPPRPLFSPAAAPPPPSLPPAPRHHHNQQPAVGNLVFGNMDAAATGTYKPPSHVSRGGGGGGGGGEQLLMFGSFGPFPYQGPQQPHVPPPQDMVAPVPEGGASASAAGAMAGGGSSGGASASTKAGAYRNRSDEAGSFLQSLNLAGGQDAGGDELAAATEMDMDMLITGEHVAVNGASEDAALMAALFDDINNHGAAAGSPAPLVGTDYHQVLAMASKNVIVNDPTMAAGRGAFGSSDASAATFAAAAANGDHQLELGSDIYGSLMDGDDDDTSFPLDALLQGVPSPLLVDDLHGGAAAGGGVASGSLIGEEGGGGDMNELEGLNGLEIPHDVFQLDDILFPPQHKNKKNVRE